MHDIDIIIIIVETELNDLGINVAQLRKDVGVEIRMKLRTAAQLPLARGRFARFYDTMNTERHHLYAPVDDLSGDADHGDADGGDDGFCAEDAIAYVGDDGDFSGDDDPIGGNYCGEE